MICYDTNIIIYLGNGTLTEDIVGNEPICYSSVTRIEALGYPDILSAEEQRINGLFAAMMEIPLSESVIQSAVRFRQLKRMSLGDAIIAATAVESGGVLWTVNIEDFNHIESLRLVNPLIKQDLS